MPFAVDAALPQPAKALPAMMTPTNIALLGRAVLIVVRRRSEVTLMKSLTPT
jgi:hypothetical protein